MFLHDTSQGSGSFLSCGCLVYLSPLLQDRPFLSVHCSSGWPIHSGVISDSPHCTMVLSVYSHTNTVNSTTMPWLLYAATLREVMGWGSVQLSPTLLSTSDFKLTVRCAPSRTSFSSWVCKTFPSTLLCFKSQALELHCLNSCSGADLLLSRDFEPSAPAYCDSWGQNV